MSFRKVFGQKKNSPKGDTESTGPVLPRPWSHLGFRLSKPTPPTLQKPESNDGATSAIPSVSGHHLPTPGVDGREPLKLSGYTVDPTIAYENKPNRTSTESASALPAVVLSGESSDAFTPLKSVAAGLSAILKYYDAVASRKSIESLIPRIEGLAKSLSTPVPEGEVKEIERRRELKKKLKKTLRDLEWLAEQGKIKGFLDNAKDAETMTDLVQDIRDATMDYQTALQQDIYYKNHQIVDTAERSLLSGMHHTADAGYRCGNRQGCLEGTRKEVLLHIEQWLTDERDQRVFWLNGLAGTGKSTIAQTFAETSFADGKLGASFFCSRDSEDKNNLGAIFPTLAFQLAYQYPQFRKQLLRALKANPDVARESLSSQLEHIIIHPFKETKIPTLIIIDALDECKDKEPASALLSVLSRHVHEIPEVKFFITGRPEPPIREGFRLESLRPITDVLKLHDVERTSVDEDIKLYLKTCLTDIRKTRSDCKFRAEWPIDFDINFMCKKAGGLFIYASTVIKFIASKYHLPTERLDLIILRSRGSTHEGGIDLLYTQILELAFQDADPGEQELYSNFRNVVGAVLLVFHPLSRVALSTLLGTRGTPSHISTTLRFLHSLLNVPDSEDEPIRIFHKSFPDFLTDRTRCKDDRFFVDHAVQHENILFSCLVLMKKHLKKNICDLDDHAVLTEVMDLSARRESCIGSSLEYACRFWTKHLKIVPGDGLHAQRIREAIDEFFTKRLLCWIEVLSITGHLGAAVYAINDIRQWYISAGISTCKQADDSERLILGYFDVIRDSPSHIYHSALPLSPSSSWLRECYKAEVVGQVEVLMGLPDQWDACSRTIVLEDRPLTFALWEDIIAVGIKSNVILLDAITGIRTAILSGHNDKIRSLAFSPDGTLLISRSEDRTVNLWDVQTGGVIRTFGDDTSSISAASVSPGGTAIALGTESGTIHLWSVRTGECHSIEKCQGKKISVISFSPTDSQRLISLSQDGIVRQWGIDGHQIGDSYYGGDKVWDLAYTSNGTRFVSCGGRVVTVRDSKDGAVVVQLEAPTTDPLRLCSSSPDGKLIAAVSSTTIYVWDTAVSGTPLVGRLVGHAASVIFIAFSSSLISGSVDQSVKFWQSSSFLADSTTTDHTIHPAAVDSGWAPAPGLILSVNLFAEDGVVVTTDFSGVVKTWDFMRGGRGREKSSFQTPVKGGQIRDTHLANDTLTLVWYGDEGYHVWNVYGGELLRKFPGPFLPDDLKFSEDGSKIFVLEPGCIRAVSIQTGKDVGCVEFDGVVGSNLWVRGSKVGINRHHAGWDFGDPKIPYLGNFPDRPRLDLVRATRGRKTETRWIEDTITKNRVFLLPERYAEEDAIVEWDGRYLLLWSHPGEVMVVDFDQVCPLF